MNISRPASGSALTIHLPACSFSQTRSTTSGARGICFPACRLVDDNLIGPCRALYQGALVSVIILQLWLVR